MSSTRPLDRAADAPRRDPLRRALRSDLLVLRAWPARTWVVTAGWSVVLGFAIGVPTDLVPTPLFQRQISAPFWTYPAWVLSAGLSALVVVAMRRSRRAALDGRAWGGGLLSFFAIGCPTCNQLVVALFGAGGAVSVFAPLQPVLSLASFALLAFALHRALQPVTCLLPGGDGFGSAP